MTTIKLKELRENLGEYCQKVKTGQSFIVIRRSEPIFKISPVNEGAWEEVIDFTKIKKGGVDVKEILKRL
ncbi:hypothetical protein HZB94_01360 [Candidatus Falkowbacteria bacterium]|nr:hypothetical protein [Candidatus Falkowbacteria bacterium]